MVVFGNVRVNLDFVSLLRNVAMAIWIASMAKMNSIVQETSVRMNIRNFTVLKIRDVFNVLNFVMVCKIVHLVRTKLIANAIWINSNVNLAEDASEPIIFVMDITIVWIIPMNGTALYHWKTAQYKQGM